MKTQQSIRDFDLRRSLVRVLVSAMAIVLFDTGLADATQAEEARDDVAIVTRLLTAETIIIAKFDVTQLKVPDSDEREIQVTDEWLRSLRAASGGQPLYAIAEMPAQWPAQPAVLFTPTSEDVDRQSLLQHLSRLLSEPEMVEHEGMVVVSAGDREPLEARLKDGRPSPRAELKDAFQAVEQFPIQVLFLPPEHLRRTFVELTPQLPESWGGGRSEIWFDGIRWAAVGIDPAQMDAELIVQSASAQAAERFGEHVDAVQEKVFERILPAGNEQAAWKNLLATLRPQFVAERQDARWIVRLDDEAAPEVMATAILRTVTEFGYQVDKLKQIVLAMHNHWSAYKVLPPREEHRDEQGKPFLSWRVHLLPFLEHAELYRQFRLDEPWDSPHNRELIEKMPSVYASSQWDVPAGQTTFLAPVGEDTIFGGDKVTTFRYVIDGMSNTIAVVEVEKEHAVPWTAPDDYRFDPQDPAAGLRGSSEGRFSAALMDGSVVRLRMDAPAEMLLRLFQKGDGKVVDWDAVR